MAFVTTNQPPGNIHNVPPEADKHINVSTRLSEGAAQMDEAANLRQPERDKLEMIDIIEGIRSGNMPTNEKFSYFLEELCNIRAIQERQHLMSPDGQRLLVDFKTLLKTLQKALYVKNRQQTFQSFYRHLYSVNFQDASAQGKPNLAAATGASGEQVKDELKGGASAITNILKLIVSNGEFRSQLSELISIAQEIFTDASNKMNETVQSGSEKLNQNAQHMNDRLQEYAEEGKEQISNDQEAIDNIDRVDDIDQNDVKKNIAGGANDVQQRRSDLQEQAKQEVRGRATQAKQYARDKFPPERVDEIVNRLKLVFSDIQRHPKYKDAIDTLVWLINVWSERLNNVGEYGSGQTKEAVTGFRSEPNWSSAESELKSIIEAWAQGHSIDSFLGSVQKVVADVKNDDDLLQCYDESKQYLRQLTEEPGYASADQSTEDGRRLVRRARELTEGRYRDRIDFMFDEAKSFLRAMNDDPMSRELEESLRQIHKDLWYDRDGNAAFKPHLLTDMRMTLIPAFLEFIKVIPIPKVDYSDPQFDISVENIMLPGDTLLPHLVEMKMENYVRFSPYTNVTNLNQQGIWIKMSQITTEIKDVIWYYKKKTGFPKLTDHGVASVIIGGRGLTITARIISDSKDPVHTFRVAQCKAHIANLQVKVNKSNHNILYKTVNPLMTSIVKRQISRGIEAKFKEIVETADSRLTGMMMQHYKESMTKTETWTDLATTGQSQQQQRIAVDSQGRPIASKDRFERPGLMTAFVTILNRNMKSNMVRGIQDQKAKRQERKAEKQARRESRQQQDTGDRYDNADYGSEQFYSAKQTPQQYQPVGAATGPSWTDNDDTVPVTVNPDGSTYITDARTGQLRPVNLSQEAYDYVLGRLPQQQQQQQQQPRLQQQNPGANQTNAPSSFGRGFYGAKRTSQDLDRNQGYVDNPTGPAPNVA